jgi:YVTN family beta-propeller protein
MKAVCTLAILFVVLASIGNAQSNAGYHIVKKTLIGGEGGWDYLLVDAQARCLYVSHGDRVVVLNADSVTVVGEISKTQGVHGIALAPELGRGFTSNGRTSTVTIFDMKTLKVIKEVPANGKNPDAILYDPFSKKLFTFNGRSSDASVLDPSTGDTIAAIPMGGKPEFAVTDLKGLIYVNNEDKSEINVVDTKTLKVISHWSLAPGESPSGLAFDMKNHRLFSVCSNKLMVVMDSENGKVIATVPIGSGVDACAYDPETNMVFASNGEGTMTVIHQESPDKYSVIETVATQRGARTMALDLKTHAVFTPSAEYGATPPPTAERPRPRPAIVPNSFVVLQLQK